MPKTFSEVVQELEVGTTKLIPILNAESSLCEELKDGIILNLATWSGPAFTFFKLFYEFINKAKVEQVFVLDHDNSYEFQQLFDSPDRASCHGYCEIFIIEDSKVIYKSTKHDESTIKEFRNQIEKVTNH